MKQKDLEKKEVISCIRKVWGKSGQKIIGLPESAPFKVGDMVLVLKIDENVLSLPSNTKSYLRVFLDKNLK